ILFIVLLIAGVPLYIFSWMMLMFMGTVVRPPLHLIWLNLTLSAVEKSRLKREILEIMETIRRIV
ncbi:MAG: hypothetical protein ABIQ02_08770, partial [Saprospiraceae bacterium]